MSKRGFVLEKQRLFQISEGGALNRIMRLTVKIPKVNSSRFLLWIALAATIISETLINAKLINDSNVTKIIQYIIILTPLGLNFLVFIFRLSKWKERLLFTNELTTMLILVIVLGILSLYRSVIAGQFAFNSMIELIQIMLPFVFTFFIINLLTFDEIASFMKFTLICTIIGYLFTLDFNSITVSNLIHMLAVSTYSPFENSAFAEVASGLGAYFIYNRKKMPIEAFMAVVLNFLIWKRVLVLMAVFLLITSLRGKADDVLNRRLVLVTSVVWPCIVFGMYYIYQPEIANYLKMTFHINLESFTLYRIYRLWYCYENSFQSYGLGSTSRYINNYGSYLGSEFEMDFIRIMFEVGPIAIIAICYAYLKITRGNKYAYVLINFCFLNLLMANGLLRYWGYALRIITIAVINYYDSEKNLVNPEPYGGIYIKKGGGHR